MLSMTLNWLKSLTLVRQNAMYSRTQLSFVFHSHHAIMKIYSQTFRIKLSVVPAKTAAKKFTSSYRRKLMQQASIILCRKMTFLQI